MYEVMKFDGVLDEEELRKYIKAIEDEANTKLKKDGWCDSSIVSERLHPGFGVFRGNGRFPMYDFKCCGTCRWDDVDVACPENCWVDHFYWCPKDTQRRRRYMFINPFRTIKKVIFNNPATIVLWEDGTKTVVKCEGETFDKEKGLAMAIAKKFLGTNESGGNYYDIFKKWIPEDELKDSGNDCMKQLWIEEVE